MIIGLTGTYASGKDTVAEYLEKTMNFEHFSLSDELRRELEKRGIPPLREKLIEVGTELRQREGNSTLAKRALMNFKPGRNYVVTSIRHPAEIEELKKHGDFFMANVDAPAELRFRRIQNRRRRGDPETLEKLLEMEKLESQTSGSGQQLGECMKKADYTLVNDDGSLEGLYSRIESMVLKFLKNKN
jgi:dephospho-CoA kinase